MPEFREKIPLRPMFEVIRSFFTFNAKNRSFQRHKRTLGEVIKITSLSRNRVLHCLKILKNHGCLTVKRDRTRGGRGRKPNIYFLKIEEPGEVIAYPEDRDPNEPQTELVLLRDGLNRKLSYLKKEGPTRHLRTLTVLEERAWKRTKGLPSWEKDDQAVAS